MSVILKRLDGRRIAVNPGSIVFVSEVKGDRQVAIEFNNSYSTLVEGTFDEIYDAIWPNMYRVLTPAEPISLEDIDTDCITSCGHSYKDYRPTWDGRMKCTHMADGSEICGALADDPLTRVG